MGFKVGDSVICVDDSAPQAKAYKGFRTGLTRGNVYTVLKVYADEDQTQPDAIGDITVLEVHHGLYLARERFVAALPGGQP